MKRPFSSTEREALLVQWFSAERCAERVRRNYTENMAFTAERSAEREPVCSVVQRVLSLRRDPQLNGWTKIREGQAL